MKRPAICRSLFLFSEVAKFISLDNATLFMYIVFVGSVSHYGC